MSVFASVRGAGKLTDRGFSVLLLLEFDNARSTGATVRLVLDFSALDLADCGKELHEVLIAGWPWQVTDVDRVAGLSARSREVGEGVGRVWTSTRLETWASATWSTTIASGTSGETSASAEAASEATATSEASSATKATCEASTAAKAAATTKATRSAGEAVFANLKVSALPLIAIELVDGVSRIIHSLESHYAGTLRTTIGCHVDIGAEDRASVGSLAEQVFQILPTHVVWKLGATVSNCFFKMSGEENGAQTLAT
jgi:hypothetical protein